MQKPILIFDFDGTIADSLSLVHELYNTVGPRFGALPLPPDSHGSFTSLPPRVLIQEYHVRPWTLPFIVRTIIKKMNARLNEIQPHTAVIDQIIKLATQGYQLVILTSNSRKNAITLLNQWGVTDRFNEIISYKALFGKHRALRKLCRKYNIDPQRVIYIGDEVRDIEGAQKAGIKNIAVSWGYQNVDDLQTANPDLLINDPHDLLNAIHELSGTPRYD